MCSRRIWGQDKQTRDKKSNNFLSLTPERKFEHFVLELFSTSWNRKRDFSSTRGSLKSTASTSFLRRSFIWRRERSERATERGESEWESATAGQEIGQEGKKETNGSLRSSFGSKDRGHKKFGHNNGLENHYSLKGPTLTFERCWTQLQKDTMLASWEEQRDRKLLQKLVTSFRFTSILLPSSSSGAKKLSLWFQICDDFGRVINPQVAAVPSPKERNKKPPTCWRRPRCSRRRTSIASRPPSRGRWWGCRKEPRPSCGTSSGGRFESNGPSHSS